MFLTVDKPVNQEPVPQGKSPEADRSSLGAQSFPAADGWTFGCLAESGRGESSTQTIAKPTGVLQRRLAIGAVDDPLEHQADQMADHVMQMPLDGATVGSAPPQLSRKCAGCEEEDEATKVRAKPAQALRGGQAAPQSVRKVLQGGGNSLGPTVRNVMESSFQRDFSSVRIHTDTAAAASAQDVNALAYTVGGDIVFGSGQYSPQTQRGRHLLAHELAHVVQQTPAHPRRPSTQAAPSMGMPSSADAMSTPSAGPRPQQLAAAQANGPALVQRAVSTGAALGVVGGGVAAGGLIGGLVGGPIGALIGAAAGAAVAGVGLLVENLVGDKRKSAADGPDLLDDPKTRTIFEGKLKEGLTILHSQSSGCAFPRTKDWRYDEERWVTKPKQGKVGEFEYLYRGSSAAEGVDALFDHFDKWDCDCALYTELATLYAMRHTLGTAEYNRRFPVLRVSPHGSTGAPRVPEDAPVEDLEHPAKSAKAMHDFDQRWADSPVGTEVSWRNNSGRHQPGWEFEHAIKVTKGGGPLGAGDRYDAHPISVARHEQGKPTELTEDEIKEGMARHSNDGPTKFVVAPDLATRLRGEGIPADVIAIIQSVKIDEFRTRDALVAGIEAALGAAGKRVSIDGLTKTNLVNTTISACERPDEPSLKSARDGYVRDNIVRNNFARLHVPVNK